VQPDLVLLGAANEEPVPLRRRVSTLRGMPRIVHPPTSFTKAQRAERRSLYLAGPFEGGEWRDDVITAMSDLDVDIYDPRNGVWETPAALDLAAGAFAGMLDWQLANAEQARVVIVWLPAGASAMTATLQLGYLAAKRGGPKKGSTVIIGPDGEKGKNHLLRTFVANTRVSFMGALPDVIRVARYELVRTDM
jgi:hypothetical protein